MATIDLGKIKLVWKGTYNNSTAYVVDDLVEYTDSGITSTYICVANSTGNAPSSSGTAHASWNYVAKGVADPIPSQSGNSGKALITNGSAVSWGSAGKTLQTKFDHHSGVSNTGNNIGNKSYSAGNFTSSDGTLVLEIQITPVSNTSHFLIQHSGDYGCGGNAMAAIALWHGTTRITTACGNFYSNDNSGIAMIAWVDTTGLSGVQTFQVRMMGSIGGHTMYSNADHSGNTKSTKMHLIIQEIED